VLGQDLGALARNPSEAAIPPQFLANPPRRPPKEIFSAGKEMEIR
jgi:hypothetical protein